ncbi:MAG: hypothetical protein WD990_08395 [Acidimicrobiia bacterium]
MSTTETPTAETATFTVEASTAERALAEVNSRLGPGAVILDARKIRKGGVAGFFATELVRLEATAGAGPTGDSADFGHSLRVALAEPDDEADDPDHVVAVGPAAGLAQTEPPVSTPASAAQDPVVVAPAAPGAWRLAGEIRWDSGRLARLDVPAQILDAVTGVDPRDDLGWIAAIAGAVAPWCRPLPRGASEFVGPGSDRLATALEVSVAGRGSAGERYGHLVVDERGTWDAAFGDDVLAVSWSRLGGAPTALRLAASMGLVLGYGMTDALGAPALRLSAVDVALTLRELAACQ